MVFMYGVYKIYKDGNLVAQEKNKLTVLGRANALKSLLGQNQYFANSLGIGISNVSNGSEEFLTINDLDFSVGRYPISTASLGNVGVNDGLVYSARIKDSSRYNINEVGIFSNVVTEAISVSDFTLFNFESGDQLKETVSATDYYITDTFSNRKSELVSDLVNYRIGKNAVKITGAGKVFFKETPIDLSSINPYDTFALAAYSSGTKSITVNFIDVNNVSLPYTFYFTVGYSIQSNNQQSNSSYKTLDWSQIATIEIVSDSTGYIILDGLKIKPQNVIDNTEGLLSRTVLSSPIEKDYGSIIDIEYILSVNLET